MRRAPAAVVFMAVAVAVSAVSAVGASSAGAAAPPAITSGVTALYEMNEPPGTTVMLDSSGNGNHGVVDPTGVESGGVYDGETAYHWVYRSPTEPPASPERVVHVPDSEALEPAGQDFTIELRVRFTDKFGNIAQKGQSVTPGGQWKIQAPKGIPSCLFKGSEGRVATGAKTALDDGTWHTLTCVLDSSGVTMYVDGEYRSTKAGSTGMIDNDFPMTIGGKTECDQINVTCDYYSGQVDRLRITKGANQDPVAAFSADCPDLTCAFDATTSTDADGDLAYYDWSFGDGTTGSGATPTHIFTESGTYRVRLTVRDNRGATSSAVQYLDVVGLPVVSAVQHVGTTVAAGNNATPSVELPAGAAAGDRLVLVLSLNNLTSSAGEPTGVGALTPLGGNVAKTLSTTVWTSTLTETDPGSTVTVPLTGGNAKYSLTAAVYSGVADDPTLAVAHGAGVTPATVRLTPVVSGIADGSWVVSYWADKSSSTTTWTPDASVVTRGTGCGTGSARICSALADSGAKTPAVYGDVPATVDATSSSAVMWSIVLPTAPTPPPPNQPPTASFSTTCTALTCTFDASASSDLEGPVAAFDWSFGDGTTGSGAAPSHAYDAPGSYDVTLTVTDADGATASITHQATPDGEAVPVSYVGSEAAVGSGAQPSMVLPADLAAGDRLLLVLSVNSTGPAIPDPDGWTRLETTTVKTLVTTVWAKTATAADTGATVALSLSTAVKWSLAAAAYRGADTTALPVFATATDATSAMVRQTPPVSAPAGSWVVSSWADKSGTTAAWTTDQASARQAVCAPGGGRVCSLLADSGASVTGDYGPIAATTDAESGSATLWSVVLTPAG